MDLIYSICKHLLPKVKPTRGSFVLFLFQRPLLLITSMIDSFSRGSRAPGIIDFLRVTAAFELHWPCLVPYVQ